MRQRNALSQRTLLYCLMAAVVFVIGPQLIDMGAYVFLFKDTEVFTLVWQHKKYMGAVFIVAIVLPALWAVLPEMRVSGHSELNLRSRLNYTGQHRSGHRDTDKRIALTNVGAHSQEFVRDDRGYDPTADTERSPTLVGTIYRSEQPDEEFSYAGASEYEH
jgi:hypothetical protein